MVLSRKYKFVFLHSRKTGGSAVKAYLNHYLGPCDIQLGAWKGAFKNDGGPNMRVIYDSVRCLLSNPLSSLRPILSCINSIARRSDKEAVAKLLNHLQKKWHSFKNPGHPTAHEVEQAFTQEWNRFWSFCFVRNPFEKAVSDYLWRKRMTGAEGVSFGEFMNRVAYPKREDPEGMVVFPRTNWSIYTIDDSVAVDFVGRYERFEDHLQFALGEAGVPSIAEKLPKAKESSSYDYRTFYDSHTYSLVETVYQKEINKFGYSFENKC